MRGAESSIAATDFMLLRTNTGCLYYDVVGDGPPVVFVSGWALSSECWRPAVQILSRSHRCVAYDQRGIAKSQPFELSAGFTVEDHAEDLHSILEDAGIFDAVIVAHEVGSLIAASLLDRHPQDGKSLVLISPRAQVSREDIKTLAVFTPAALALRELAAFPVLRNIVTRRFRRVPQPYRDRLFEDFAELSPRAAYETALSASNPEATELLDSVISQSSAPSLFVCGEKDKKGAIEARRLFSLARAAKLATMRDCGFMPMLEYSRQFAKLIQDFISSDEQSRNRASIKRNR